VQGCSVLLQMIWGVGLQVSGVKADGGFAKREPEVRKSVSHTVFRCPRCSGATRPFGDAVPSMPKSVVDDPVANVNVENVG
jgi:hypothetical protein